MLEDMTNIFGCSNVCMDTVVDSYDYTVLAVTHKKFWDIDNVEYEI